MKTIAFLSCIMLFSLSVSGITGGVNSEGWIIVPNVEGISVAVATDTLLMADLAPRLVSSAQPAALIVRQEPRPGSKLPFGGQVTLTTSLTDDLSRVASPTDTRALIPPTTVFIADSASRSRPMSYPHTLTSSGSSVNAMGILTLPDGQGTVFYQPSQAPVTPYFTQNTAPRLYPSWYPKSLLQQGAVSPSHAAEQFGIASTPGVDQSQIYYEILVTPTGSTTLRRLYPRVDPYQPGSAGILNWEGVPPTTPPVGGYATSPNPAVSMPNVLRLYQADATAALSRAGLVSSAIYVNSAEGRSSVVVQQSPDAYTLIQSGSVVQLWISR